VTDLQYYIASLDTVGKVIAFLLLCVAWGLILVGTMALMALATHLIYLFRKKK
jgi:hypothetical protein